MSTGHHRAPFRSRRILPSLLAGLLSLAVGLQSFCPILCVVTGSCLTGAHMPAAVHKPGCCHNQAETGTPSDRAPAKPCCSIGEMALANAQVPATPDHAADILQTAQMLVAPLFDAPPVAVPVAAMETAALPGGKSPPLSRPQLSVYRI
jgi:hypothetical protein